MTSLIQQAAFLASRNVTSPMIQFQRFRGKINIQRPRQPHYDRALVLALTQPKPIEKEKTLNCFKPNPAIPPKLHCPYNDIIAREVLNWLNQSRMVAVFHLNSVTEDELFKTRVLLHQSNMHLKSYGKKIIAQAVKDTRFEAIMPLFESHFCIVFSPDQNVKQLLRITRKAPQMILLAGIVDNTLLSRNEFVAYGELPGLQAAQSELVNTLNMASSNLVQQLQAHQNNFVNILDVYAKSGDSESSGGNKATTANDGKICDTAKSEDGKT